MRRTLDQDGVNSFCRQQGSFRFLMAYPALAMTFSILQHIDLRRQTKVKAGCRVVWGCRACLNVWSGFSKLCEALEFPHQCIRFGARRAVLASARDGSGPLLGTELCSVLGLD